MIIQCQCGQKNRIPDTPDARSAYLCGHCGTNLYFPAGSNTTIGAGKHHESRARRIPRLSLRDLAILAVACVLLYGLWQSVNVPEPCNQPTPTNPDKAKEQEIVCQDAGKSGDPDLDADYQEVNADYFRNKLPRIPVIWEPKLAEVGPLVAKDFILEGLANPDPELILINPRNRGNQAGLRRVLCHEMVHIYLFTIGDMKTKHGPAFQTELRKLWQEGAFQGIPATEDKKLSLRSWLTSESAKLSAESIELKRKNAGLDRAHLEIERRKKLAEGERHELNQRISLANERGNGWPSDDKIEAFRAGVRRLNQQIENFGAAEATFRTSLTNYKAEVTHYNSQVSRYNLMMAYPDGLDENSMIPPLSQSKIRMQSSPLPNLIK